MNNSNIILQDVLQDASEKGFSGNGAVFQNKKNETQKQEKNIMDVIAQQNAEHYIDLFQQENTFGMIMKQNNQVVLFGFNDVGKMFIFNEDGQTIEQKNPATMETMETFNNHSQWIHYLFMKQFYQDENTLKMFLIQHDVAKEDDFKQEVIVNDYVKEDQIFEYLQYVASKVSKNTFLIKNFGFLKQKDEKWLFSTELPILNGHNHFELALNDMKSLFSCIASIHLVKDFSLLYDNLEEKKQAVFLKVQSAYEKQYLDYLAKQKDLFKPQMVSQEIGHQNTLDDDEVIPLNMGMMQIDDDNLDEERLFIFDNSDSMPFTEPPDEPIAHHFPSNFDIPDDDIQVSGLPFDDGDTSLVYKQDEVKLLERQSQQNDEIRSYIVETQMEGSPVVVDDDFDVNDLLLDDDVPIIHHDESDLIEPSVFLSKMLENDFSYVDVETFFKWAYHHKDEEGDEFPLKPLRISYFDGKSYQSRKLFYFKNHNDVNNPLVFKIKGNQFSFEQDGIQQSGEGIINMIKFLYQVNDRVPNEIVFNIFVNAIRNNEKELKMINENQMNLNKMIDEYLTIILENDAHLENIFNVYQEVLKKQFGFSQFRMVTRKEQTKLECLTPNQKTIRFNKNAWVIISTNPNEKHIVSSGVDEMFKNIYPNNEQKQQEQIKSFYHFLKNIVMAEYHNNSFINNPQKQEELQKLKENKINNQNKIIENNNIKQENENHHNHQQNSDFQNNHKKHDDNTHSHENQQHDDKRLDNHENQSVDNKEMDNETNHQESERHEIIDDLSDNNDNLVMMNFSDDVDDDNFVVRGIDMTTEEVVQEIEEIQEQKVEEVIQEVKMIDEVDEVKSFHDNRLLDGEQVLSDFERLVELEFNQMVAQKGSLMNCFTLKEFLCLCVDNRAPYKVVADLGSDIYGIGVKGKPNYFEVDLSKHHAVSTDKFVRKMASSYNLDVDKEFARVDGLLVEPLMEKVKQIELLKMQQHETDLLKERVAEIQSNQVSNDLVGLIEETIGLSDVGVSNLDENVKGEVMVVHTVDETQSDKFERNTEQAFNEMVGKTSDFYASPLRSHFYDYNLLINKRVVQVDFIQVMKKYLMRLDSNVPFEYNNKLSQYLNDTDKIQYFKMGEFDVKLVVKAKSESWELLSKNPTNNVAQEGQSLMTLFKGLLAEHNLSFKSTVFHQLVSNDKETNFWYKYPMSSVLSNFDGVRSDKKKNKYLFNDLKLQIKTYADGKEVVSIWNGHRTISNAVSLVQALLGSKYMLDVSNEQQLKSHELTSFPNVIKELKNIYFNLNTFTKMSIINHTGLNERGEIDEGSEESDREKFERLLPAPSLNNNLAYDYLVNKRKINPVVVEAHMGHSVYQGLYNHLHTWGLNDEIELKTVVVFVSPTCASVRGCTETSDDIKRNVPGSKLSEPFTLLPLKGWQEANGKKIETVAIVEAGVDALSYACFYPNDTVVSSFGLNLTMFEDALKSAKSMMNTNQIKFVYACDNINYDENGQILDSASRNAYFGLINNLSEFCYENFIEENESILNREPMLKNDELIDCVIKLLENKKYNENKLEKLHERLNNIVSDQHNEITLYHTQFKQEVSNALFEIEYVDNGLFELRSPQHPKYGQFKDWNEMLTETFKNNPQKTAEEIYDEIIKDFSPNLIKKQIKQKTNKNNLTI